MRKTEYLYMKEISGFLLALIINVFREYDKLADWCHISETHFRRVFSSYMQMSPLEYINLVRIQNACDYLKKTDEPISDIAYKCGFSIVSTFYRNFKQIMGVTPYEWRKRPENYEQQILKSEVRSKEDP